MRVLVTGSRTWEAAAVIRTALDILAKEAFAIDEELVIVHGACPKGADAIADEWVRDRLRQLWPVGAERHPANWRDDGHSAGFKRNERMVKAGADLCLAFIHHRSKGASHCANLAEREGITVRRFES
jgi:hypothetical protein